MQDSKKFIKLLAPVLLKATSLVFERGEGPYLYTAEGKKYLDYVSGIAVNNLGHCHPKVVAAIKEQAEKLIHPSFSLGYYPSALNFVAKLTKYTPGDLDTVFFSNSGAEAVEASLKFARYITKKPVYITYRGAFHGRSFGATSATSASVSYRAGYEPLLSSVYHAPYPYCFRCPYKQKVDSCSLECLEEITRMFDYLVDPSTVALVLIEPVQGEGGYIVPPQKYMNALVSLCKEKGLLLALDEIQTGFGRTGHMFAAEHFGIQPDIIVLGKAIASGMPLSAIVSRKELMEKWTPGSHGSTYGANPVSCAAALASLEVIEEEDVLKNCQKVGSYFRDQLLKLQEKFPVIGDVRGLGLMLAVELVDAKGAPNAAATKAINQYCYENGVLFYNCGTYKNCIRFMTPLNITTSVVDEGLTVLEKALEKVSN